MLCQELVGHTELSEESFAGMNRHLCPVCRWGILVINGYGLHHVAIIVRECTPVANSTPHAHVKCVVGGRLFGVVQPENKIVLTHILPKHEVLIVTKLKMNSSMCLSNVRVNSVGATEELRDGGSGGCRDGSGRGTFFCPD